MTETLVRPAATGRQAEERTGWGALCVVLTAIFMTTLDFFIVNVAIPVTQRDLHAGPAAVQFIVAGYGLALAAGLITGGRLGDMFGRRRMFVTGMALFTAASAMCGLAPDVAVLIAARVAQGVAAALLMPQVLAIVNTTYTGPSRVRAFNAYGLAIGFGGVFGQLIGGVLIRLDIAGLGWRSIFLINVPVGLAAALLAPRLVPESRAESRARLDLVGMVLVTLGLVAIVLPLIEGQQQGWPEWTWVCLGASLPLLGGFVAYQNRLGRRDGSPLVRLELFKERAFSAGLAVVVVFQLAMASFFLLLALYLQQGKALTPLASGVIFLTLGTGFFAASMLAPRVAARIGRQVIALGSVAVAAGYALLAVTAEWIGAAGGVAWIIPALAVSGAGMGLVIAPMQSLILARVKPHHAAAASGVVSTGQQVGGAVGVAIAGIVFYGAVGHGVVHAFGLGLLPLVGFSIVAALLAQLLPRR